MSEPVPTICSRLEQLRTELFGDRGKSRMARQLGIRPSTYDRYERDRVPPADLLVKIANVGNVTLRWLITGEGPRHPAQQLDPEGEDLTRRFEAAISYDTTLRPVARAFLQWLDDRRTRPDSTPQRFELPDDRQSSPQSSEIVDTSATPSMTRGREGGNSTSASGEDSASSGSDSEPEQPASLSPMQAVELTSPAEALKPIQQAETSTGAVPSDAAATATSSTNDPQIPSVDPDSADSAAPVASAGSGVSAPFAPYGAAQATTDETDDGGSLDSTNVATESLAANQLIPIVGRTSAGVARFWSDVVSDEDLDQTALIDRLLAGGGPEARVAVVSGNEIESEASDIAALPAATIVQLASEQAGAVEFLQAADLKARFPRAIAWQVDGDSMEPRYFHGDLVVTSLDAPAVEGQPCIARQRGQIGVNCKVFHREGSRIVLIPINPRVDVQRVEADEIESASRVLFVVRR